MYGAGQEERASRRSVNENVLFALCVCSRRSVADPGDDNMKV